MIRIRMSPEMVSDLMFMQHRQTMIMSGLNEQYPIVEVSMDKKISIITFMLDDGKEEVVDQLLEYRHPMYNSNNADLIADTIDKCINRFGH